MDALRRFKQPDLFLSLKRDLATVSNLTYLWIKYLATLSFFLFFTWDSFVIFMQVTQQVFVAEEWVKATRNQVRAEAHSYAEAEKSLGALK